MFLKKVSLILATAILAFSLAGCGGGDKKEEKKAPAADKPIKIGVTAGPHARANCLPTACSMRRIWRRP